MSFTERLLRRVNEELIRLVASFVNLGRGAFIPVRRTVAERRMYSFMYSGANISTLSPAIVGMILAISLKYRDMPPYL